MAAATVASASEIKEDYEAGESTAEIARTQYYRWGSVTGETPEESKVNDAARSDAFFEWLMKSGGVSKGSGR